jgi:hypothetical protein
MLIVVIFIWVICGAFCAIIADSKNRSSGGWFFVGLFFGLFALIAIAGMPSLEKEISVSAPEIKKVTRKTTTENLFI